MQGSVPDPIPMDTALYMGMHGDQFQIGSHTARDHAVRSRSYISPCMQGPVPDPMHAASSGSHPHTHMQTLRNVGVP